VKRRRLKLGLLLLVFTGCVVFWTAHRAPSPEHVAAAPPTARRFVPPPAVAPRDVNPRVAAVSPETASLPPALDPAVDETRLDTLGGIILDATRPAEERSRTVRALAGVISAENETHLLFLVSATTMTDRLRIDLIEASLNRPLRLQAEIALAVLAQGGPDARVLARTLLHSLTDRDHGEDLSAWQEAVAASRLK